LIDQARDEQRTVVARDVGWGNDVGEQRSLEVQVYPLFGGTGERIGYRIVFGDVTRFAHLQDELLRSRQELETAYEEVQSTNEELETTNEELQSTVEELETTNEELQSTNEELETMNEELQSTNEELETINNELRQRTDELNDVNAILETVLTTLRFGVAVLGADLVIRVWSDRAEDLWGLRAEEAVGRQFMNLEIGLPIDRLRPVLRACLSDGSKPEEVTVDAINRRGKAVRCRVTCTAMGGVGQSNRAVMVLMEVESEAVSG
jgi:two-component system CheB/CheR fusion protein